MTQLSRLAVPHESRPRHVRWSCCRRCGGSAELHRCCSLLPGTAAEGHPSQLSPACLPAANSVNNHVNKISPAVRDQQDLIDPTL